MSLTAVAVCRLDIGVAVAKTADARVMKIEDRIFKECSYLIVGSDY